jgi:hypothetical protein
MADILVFSQIYHRGKYYTLSKTLRGLFPRCYGLNFYSDFYEGRFV